MAAIPPCHGRDNRAPTSFFNPFLPPFPEKERQFGLGHFSRGNGQDGFFQLVFGRLKAMAIEQQENQCRDSPCALVAVDERVVADNMKKVGRGHFQNIGMEEIAVKSSHRHGQRRFEQPQVADAGRADGKKVIFLKKNGRIPIFRRRAPYNPTGTRKNNWTTRPGAGHWIELEDT